MASDSLNQVGKYIKKAGKDSDRSLKRSAPIQPRLERVRDVFDSTTAFTMQVDTTDNDRRVLLDLFFTLPPPIRGCKAGCIVSHCEEFSFENGGNHSVTLAHSYIPGSVNVFINGRSVNCDEATTSGWKGTLYGFKGYGELDDNYDLVLGPDTNDTEILVIHDTDPPNVPFNAVINNETVTVTAVEEYIARHTPLKSPPVIWKTIAFLYKYMDYEFVDDDDVTKTLTYTVSDTLLDEAEAALLDYADKVSTWSNGRFQIQLTIIRPTRPLDTMSDVRVGFSPQIVDILPEADVHCPPGTYDTILVLFGNTDGVIDNLNFYWGYADPSPSVDIDAHKYYDRKSGAWVRPVGTTTSRYFNYGSGFATIYYPVDFDYNYGLYATDPGFVFAHETMHGILTYYQERIGGEQTLDDGSPNNLLGTGQLDHPEDFLYFSNDLAFLIDIYGNNVVDDDGNYLGLTPEVLTMGTPTDPRAHYWVSKFTVERGVKGTATAHARDESIYTVGTGSDCVGRTGGGKAQINEISPSSGEVSYQTESSGPDVVAICYVYSDCSEEGTFTKCPAFESTIGLTTILFSDRFDRTPGPETYGGVGYWYTNDTLVEDFNEAVTLSHYGGAALLQTPFNNGVIDGLHYVFENIRGNGPLFEVIFAVDLTSMADTFLYNTTGNGPTLTIQVGGKIQIFSGDQYQLSSSSAVNGGQVFTTFQSPIDVRQRLYIRYAYDGAHYKIRLWPMNETEPDWWFEHIPQVPTIAGAEWVRLIEGPHIGGDISGTGVLLLAIQHWGGNVREGVWNYGGEIGHSWSRGVCYSEADAGIPVGPTYFGPCASTTKSLTEFSTYANSDTIVSVHVPNNTMRAIEPTFQYKYTWDQFNPNQAYYFGLNQTVVSFMYDYGKGLNATIDGEIKWSINGSTSGTPGNIAMALMGFAYGNGTPSAGADYLAGNSITVANGFENEWVPFTLEVPVVEGHIQWGTRIVDEPVALADELGDHTGTLFLPRQAEIVLDFRRLNIHSTMAPLGNAIPFCPDTGSLASRCSPVVDSFVGPTFDYLNTVGSLTTTVGALSGQAWTLNQGNSNRVELNNSFKVLYRAKGLTADGSDGRAPDFDGIYYHDVSRSTNTASLSTEGPPSCGYSRISFKFKFGTIGNPYYPTSIIEEIDPSALTTLVYPLGGLAISGLNAAGYFRLRSSHPDATENTLLFGGTKSITNNLLPNVEYSMIIEMTNTYRAKIWRVTDPEPSAWLVEFPQTISPNGVIVGSSYIDYVDDNFYTEIKELSVTPIEPRIEGPNV